MNEQNWKETKYIIKDGKLAANVKSQYLSESSYLIASITADYYSEYIPKYVHGILADLGCGMAPLYSYYKTYADKVICADWSKSYHKNKFIDVECDLATPLLFEDNSIDTVILSDVLEHIFNPFQLLSEVHRILKPEGALLLNTPFFYLQHEKPYDYFRYTEYFYKRVARDLGYSIMALKSMGGESEVVIDILGKYLSECTLISKLHIQKKINEYFYNKWKKNRKGHSDICLGYFVVLKKREK